MGYFYLFLLTGLFYVFGNIIGSGWDLIPGNTLDSRLANYLLEHIYQYFVGNSQIHSSLWSPPFYYPLHNTLAFSDTFLSLAPIYGFFRVVFDEYFSYTMTVISIFILNYTCFYFILRKFKNSKLLSSFGSFLFAFSYCYKFSVVHVQMLTIFYTLAAILLLLNVSKRNKKGLNIALIVGAFVLYALQFYTSYYLGFFVFFVSAIALFFSLWFDDTRRRVVIFALRNKIGIILGILSSVIILLPLAYKYISLGFKREYGNDILVNIPTFKDLFTSDSVFVNFLLPKLTENMSFEFMLTIGLVSLIVGVLGLIRFRTYGKVAILTLLLSLVFVLKFKFSIDFSLWKYVYSYFPGANAIRETIRIVFVLYPLLIFGVVNFLKTANISKVWIALIVILLVFEQYYPTTYNSRSFKLENSEMQSLMSAKLPEGCKYFDVAFMNEVDDGFGPLRRDIERVVLMWYGHYSDLYFVSGYSGQSEELGFFNPKRQELSQRDDYCILVKDYGSIKKK